MTNKAFTQEELKGLNEAELSRIVLAQQEQINTLQTNYEKLIEQLRIATQNRFGRHSEKLEVIDGQLSLFNEAEETADPKTEEPVMEEVIQSYKRRKQKGKRDSDLMGFPVEPHVHPVSEEELNAFFGEGNWRAMKHDMLSRWMKRRHRSSTMASRKSELHVGTSFRRVL